MRGRSRGTRRYSIWENKTMIEMNKKTDEWFRREWSDADKILSLDREGLLWQIWKERSNRLFLFMIGILFGLCLESIAMFFREVF